LGTPLGLILSLLGVVQNKQRLAGILGLLIGVAVVALFFVRALC
jgi:hypothetical protein